MRRSVDQRLTPGLLAIAWPDRNVSFSNVPAVMCIRAMITPEMGLIVSVSHGLYCGLNALLRRRGSIDVKHLLVEGDA